MKFRIEGNPERVEWVCKELVGKIKSQLKSRFIINAKYERKGEIVILEVNTRPAFLLNLGSNEGMRNMLHVILMGMLLEEAKGASCEIMKG